MIQDLKKNYEGMTPVKWRKIGDGLLTASATLTAYAVTEDMKMLALIALGCGVIGKFVTDFFKV